MAEHHRRSYPNPENVPSQPSYAELEEETLAFWEIDGTFEASVTQRKDRPEYVFYDGPPFANGLPHYGHLLTGFVKDAIPRFKTMRGFRVDRRFGWDCHGLPAETEAQSELGVSGRQEITEYGIEAFNDYCRTSVLRYTKAWERYVNRQARWVDFANGYKTMDTTFMESVMWAFAELARRDLIYEGYRVLPYCWECETPLANFETRQDDSYRERIDPAVTVAFSLEPTPGDGPLDGGAKVLVWTTTPWTLPSNLALAVGPQLSYAVLERDGERFVLGSERVAHYEAELEGATLVATVAGSALVGRRYAPLLPYFTDTPGAFVVLGTDFVSTDEGTGVVHLAPAFGEDDQRACEAAGIPVICPVDDRGRFDERVPDFTGLQVFDANARVIARLSIDGVLVREEAYAHSYPHCWRSDTPLIYRAVSSFFVRVTALHDEMLALNDGINWVPEHVREGAFGKWLDGARDWSITRNRFWGTPIPVWKSDDPSYPRVDIYASIDELEADFGVRLTDLHRPAIDQLTRPNPDDPTGRSVMRRVTDVLDCWFESGSMPFAQLHYPFENAEWFEEHFPADFICEYIGQTRGWFYTLHVLSTALFHRPAFANCIAHGIVLGNDGRKLSKHLRNYPDPEVFFGRDGSDAMRWYMLSSAVLRGSDVIIEDRAMAEPVRQVLNPVWNVWHFLCLYAASDHVTGTWRIDQAGVLDRYILAKAAQLVAETTAAMDRYDLAGATTAISGFLDALTNWYVRRSRDRFWRPFGESEEGDADKRDAYDTLHTVLALACRVAAPFLPYLTEAIYRPLTGERSVHLTDWPEPGEVPEDRDLVAAMDLVREVCSAGSSIRKAAGLRTRLPLRRLTVAGTTAEALAPFVALIADEVNVKEVVLLAEDAGLTEERLSVVPAALGPRLGPATQQVIAAVRAGNWSRNSDGTVLAGGIALEPGEFSLRRIPLDEEVSRVLEPSGTVVTVEVALDAELEAEGLARDVIRLVQAKRKELDLDISDRIALALVVPADVAVAVTTFDAEIAAQTLATSLDVTVGGPLEGPELSDGRHITIAITPGLPAAP